MSNTFFTSDPHYGHANIIKYCNRPFADTNEMDEAMIRNWNSVVKDNDDVYILGDFAMGNRPAPEIIKRLSGRKHLIWGNHDSNQVRNCSLWASSQPYLELKGYAKFLVLCHYKFQVFNKSHRGGVQFFGHSHGSIPGNSQQIDVGVDCFNFTPIEVNEAFAHMETLPPRADEIYSEG